ncbi:MAG: 50S ribosomal protein L21 [Rhodospirillales bacterium RIFCSPLOWO2_12_FULL_58_28]|nr:MAG: 50S ribosomal protein L21 [Rhodospirillales bacterium RIFCSPLOWO2_02_FULL_58_16]OHC77432.1 MAG: 50S ribosomal protein L21 [Rhodospirillales bacterium RIFCSPLOWO2_12_FULL_58_28]
MFAVIKSGGKQYKVAANDVIIVETLRGAPGSAVELNDVLMIVEDGKAPVIGAPLLDKVAVYAEIIEQSRADKIIVFKKKRRKGYRRLAGHRQHQTVLRIKDIGASGKKTTAKAEAAPVVEIKAEAAPKAKAPKVKADAAPKAKAKAPAKKVAKAADKSKE